MENYQGSYSRSAKIKVPAGMKAQKLIIGVGGSSENVDLNAPILRYLCGGGGGGGGGGSPIAGKITPRGSRSPLSPVENILIARSPPPSSPAVYRTQVKAVEGEEVLVMDGIPLRRSSRFSGSESSGSSGTSLFKSEIFQSPEFSYTKEDLRSTRLSVKNKTESQTNSPYNNSPRLMFASSPDTIFLPETISPTFSAAAVTPTRTALPAQSMTPVRSASPSSSMTPTRPPRASLATLKPSASRATPANPNQAATATTASRITTRGSTTTLTTAWSPLDDHIEVALPSSTNGKPSLRESVDAYIDSALYGVKTQRLPVFSEICSDSQ